MSRVFVGASSFAKADDSAMRLLQDHGLTVEQNPYGRKLSTAETIEHLQGAVGLLAGLEQLDASIFTYTPQLKAIARIGVGMDNVDVDAAERMGIKVSNTPDAPADAVAEMTLTACLACLRQIVPGNQLLHQGIWDKQIASSLYGSTVLLIGYGRIARRFEQLLQPFKAKLLVFDPLYTSDLCIDQLLPQADVISLHASGNGQIIGEKELEKCKPGAILLNSARGGLVCEDAVFEALKDGRLSWYWADSFSAEPYQGKLIQLQNALLTPHISTYTARCRREMEYQAATNLLVDLGLI